MPNRTASTLIALVAATRAGWAEFLKQGEWYKVRQACAAELAKAGQTALADQVETAGG